MDRAIVDYTIEMRRYFHENPELSFKEFKTQEKILSELKSMGLNPVKIAGTGVYADIIGKNNGKTIGVRADIDALPVTENNSKTYRSKNEGVMHACGHDAHTAMVLGLSKLLVSEGKNFNGRIRVFFQPAEEAPPGGAVRMIDEGLLDGVDYVIGQHVDSQLPAGYIGYRSGPVSANSYTFFVTIQGKGGHGSRPEGGIDAIYAASLFVTSLQAVRARILPQTSPAAITVGTINGGYRHNVLADNVQLSGTVRTVTEEDRKSAEAKIKSLLEGLKSFLGISYEYKFEYGYPVMKNDLEITGIVHDEAVKIIGEKKVIETGQMLGGEDFGYYLQKKKGAFYRLGTSNRDNGVIASNHSPEFDIDEEALGPGVEVLNAISKRLLI
jgi:amidohydrolase